MPPDGPTCNPNDPSDGGIVADYPDAKWMPAHPSNYRRSGPARIVNLVIVHVTDGHSRAEPVAEMWQQANHGSSAHFVVDQDGTVIQAVRLDDVAFHAHARNGMSIGIEHCARSPKELGKDDPGLPLSDAQIQASARLVAWLCAQYGLHVYRDAIQGHVEADAQTTHADCPEGVAGGWPWDRYLDLIRAAALGVA